MRRICSGGVQDTHLTAAESRGRVGRSMASVEDEGLPDDGQRFSDMESTSVRLT